MNNIQFFIILFVISWLGACILDWWIIVPLAIILGYLTRQSDRHIWIPAFFSGFLLWIMVALFHIEFDYDNSILNRFSELLGMNNALLILVVGLIGGLLSGFSSSTGFYLKKVIKS